MAGNGMARKVIEGRERDAWMLRGDWRMFWFLVFVLVAVLTVSVVTLQPRDHQAEEAKTRAIAEALSLKAGSSALPYAEADIVKGCNRKTNEVASCIVAQRALIPDASTAWAGAGVEARLECLRGIRNPYEPVEPVARLYACLIK